MKYDRVREDVQNKAEHCVDNGKREPDAPIMTRIQDLVDNPKDKSMAIIIYESCFCISLTKVHHGLNGRCGGKEYVASENARRGQNVLLN